VLAQNNHIVLGIFLASSFKTTEKTFLLCFALFFRLVLVFLFSLAFLLAFLSAAVSLFHPALLRIFAVTS
jgi:hypothetical protein